MNKIQQCIDIAERNGLAWEVKMQASIHMEEGVNELQAYINALIDWDLI